MCLHTREASQWKVSKARNDDKKIPIEDTKVSKEAKDKKIDSKKVILQTL